MEKKKPEKLKTRFITRADVEAMEEAVQTLARRMNAQAEAMTSDGPRSGHCPVWCPLRRLKQRRR